MFWPPLFAWTASVCLSRLLMYRHHILDVCAGIALGMFEALLLSILWMDQDTCVSLLSWMTDEKISGAEYGV
jgi:presqualene diphosphate phosphatase